MEISATSSGALSLPYVIRALRARVAAWGGVRLLETVLVLLLDRRLGEIGRRVEGMLARFRAGIVWRRKAGSRALARVEAVSADGGSAPPRKRVWPSRFGWLVLVGRHEAAGLSAQLRSVLSSPEMVALLQAAPQARRVLLPLCRALAIEAELLRPGEVVVPKPKAAPKPRVRKPRPKVDWGRIPLPRGMLSAARRQGFGKIR